LSMRGLFLVCSYASRELKTQMTSPGTPFKSRRRLMMLKWLCGELSKMGMMKLRTGVGIMTRRIVDNYRAGGNFFGALQGRMAGK
jgi:hypothetical protein